MTFSGHDTVPGCSSSPGPKIPPTVVGRVASGSDMVQQAAWGRSYVLTAQHVSVEL